MPDIGWVVGICSNQSALGARVAVAQTRPTKI
jgi:hypothetical protein